MKPLVLLLSVFVLALLIIRISRGSYEFALAGRIAMSAMLLFTAMAHFKFEEGMSMMLPDFIPYKKAVIYLTGLIEVAAAIGMLLPAYRHLTAWLLILFFVLVLPANIYAAIHGVDYQHATNAGPGIQYLWFRIPLQFFFILWVYVSCLKS